MKRFLLRIVLFSILGIAITSACISWIFQHNGNKRSYIQKCEIIERTPSPRLIFVSGSNLLHGLDSKRISDSLHINVVNFAQSVDLGMRFLLDDAATYLHDGDILIIAPEYVHFYGSAYGEDAGLLTAAISAYPEKYKLLNWKQKRTYYTGYFSLLKSAILSINKIHEEKSSMNEFGDNPGMWYHKANQVYSLTRYKITQPFDSTYMREFIQNINEIGKKNKVVIIPPVIVETGYEMTQKQIDEVSQYLSSHEHPFLASPIEHVMSDTCMYEPSIYHVNKPGVDAFTGKVIEELRPMVQKKLGL